MNKSLKITMIFSFVALFTVFLFTYETSVDSSKIVENVTHEYINDKDFLARQKVLMDRYFKTSCVNLKDCEWVSIKDVEDKIEYSDIRSAWNIFIGQKVNTGDRLPSYLMVNEKENEIYVPFVSDDNVYVYEYELNGNVQYQSVKFE